MRNKALSRCSRPFAAALRYDEQEMRAPLVSAAGCDEVARRLIATAKRFGVPIQLRPELAAELQALGCEQEIPPELYDQVATVFVSIGSRPSARTTPRRRSRP